MSTTTYERIDAKVTFAADADRAQWWRKTVRVMARPAKEGERVETIIGGNLETVNIAACGDILVENPGGERYLVSGEKFALRYERYEQDGAACAEGFESYRCISDAVPCVRLERNVEFTAPWGELMRIERGGYLVLSAPDDLYGVERSAFVTTYSRCYPNGRLVHSDEWETAYSQACQNAYENFQDSRARITDAQVEANALSSISSSLVGLCDTD
jgi:hypothetical protein